MRENKTRYALLGLLAISPMSGYDMKTVIGKSLIHFWNESYGQIYPILKQLESEGLAVKSVVEQEGKPDRNVYTITEKGREAFEGWLGRPVEETRERVEIVLKLFFGGFQPPALNIQMLRQFRAEQQKMLVSYAGIRDFLASRHADDKNYPYWLMTLNCGLIKSEAMIRWADETVEQLEEIDRKNDSERKDVSK
jgi:DNA-binding PadR family transcriptional regulator